MILNIDKRILMILPIICGVMWGTGGVFVRAFNSFGFNSVSILAIRVAGALIILFILMMIFDRDALRIDLKDIWMFVGAGVFGTLMLNLCYNEAAFNISLSLSALLLSLAPIFALMFSVVLFGEKITYKKLVCLFVALFGCVLVSGLLESSSGFTWSTYGVVCGLGSAVFWALYGVFSKFASNKGYSTFTIVFYSFIMLMICLAPFTQWRLFGSYLMADPLPNFTFATLHSVITSVLPYFLFSYALTNMDSGKATILCSGAEPCSATIWGALFFAEFPSLLNLIGIVIAIAAVSVLSTLNDA